MTASPIALPLPDPPLRSGSLTLRPWRELDAPVLAAAWADVDIRRWTGVPERTDAEAAVRWISGEQARRERGLSIDLVLDVGGVALGEVGLSEIDLAARRAEVGWWVGPAHRGQGWARTAARLLATWTVEELCIDTVVARCAAANPASGRVAAAAGFGLGGVTDGIERWAFDRARAAIVEP